MAWLLRLSTFAEPRHRRECKSQATWTTDFCCLPQFAKPLHMDRKWLQLNTSAVRGIRAPSAWDGVSHVHLVEPLSVAAFAAAIHNWPTPRSGFVLDIGMNSGVYTWLASAIAPGLSLIGIDMQPKCVEIAECGLRLLHSGTFPGNVQLLGQYVSRSSDDATLNVSDDQCDVMSSVSGYRHRPGRKRRPGGVEAVVRKVTTRPVTPIALGKHLLARFSSSGERAAVVKIDTEGFETRVLESLRPAWHLLGDIIFELQPEAWKHHGVDREEGLRTLRDLIKANSYRVVTLPHTALGVGRGEAWWRIPPEFVDPCHLPHIKARATHFTPLKAGLGNATVMHGHHLERLLNHYTGFNEFLLTRRWQSC